MEVNRTEDEVSSVEVLGTAAWTKVQIRGQVNVHLNISAHSKTFVIEPFRQSPFIANLNAQISFPQIF